MPLPSDLNATAAGPAWPVLATLRVRSGLPASTLPVRRVLTRIGADRVNDLVVAGDGIASRHASLELRGGVWTVGDLSPDQSVWVDGEQVLGEAALAPGSALRLGNVACTFVPEDRWEDSPLSRTADATPFVILPETTSDFSQTLLILLGLGVVLALAFFLLRKG